jgi:hypothetical protein
MTGVDCQQCGATLRHRPGATEISEYGTVHHHYRCPTATCSADGGTIVTSDGEVTQRVGPAVDPGHGLRARGQLEADVEVAES